MNLSCFAFLQNDIENDHRLRRSVRVFMSRTPHWSFLPKTCQWTGVNKALIELVNVARVNGFSLAYLHVIHFETSRFNIKSFARVLPLFFRSFPVHLENYPECVLRTIGWARGPWENTSYKYLLGNFKQCLYYIIWWLHSSSTPRNYPKLCYLKVQRRDIWKYQETSLDPDLHCIRDQLN